MQAIYWASLKQTQYNTLEKGSKYNEQGWIVNNPEQVNQIAGSKSGKGHRI